MEREWKLSPIDSFSLNLVMKGAWIYRNSPDFHKMKEALAKLQILCPQLGGKYDGKSCSLKWDDSHPETLVFSHILHKEYSADELYGDSGVWKLVTPYNLKAFKKGRIAPFCAVFCELSDGAVLFVQCAHGVVDAHSFYKLIREWASLYKGETVRKTDAEQFRFPTPDAMTREESLFSVKEQGWIRINRRQLFRMILNGLRNKLIKTTYIIDVSQDEIDRMKAESMTGTNAVLSVIAGRSISEHLIPGRRYKMCFMADVRSRIPESGAVFPGNMSMPVPLETEFDFRLDNATLATHIDSSLKKALAPEKIKEQFRLSFFCLSYHLPYFISDPSDMNSPDPVTIHINNQLKFKACEIEWGTGLPIYAFHNGLPDMVKFWQPVCGGSIQIIYGGVASRIMKSRKVKK